MVVYGTSFLFSSFAITITKGMIVQDRIWGSGASGKYHPGAGQSTLYRFELNHWLYPSHRRSKRVIQNRDGKNLQWQEPAF